MKKSRTIFCLSCYGADTLIFSIPIRASEAWLKSVLKRRVLVNGAPLRNNQFDLLKQRAAGYAEVGWTNSLQYFLESISVSSPKKMAAELWQRKSPNR